MNSNSSILDNNNWLGPKNIEQLQKFFRYLKNYFFQITKYNRKILIISTKGIDPIHFYCKKFKYDYILAPSETLMNRLFTNYLEIKKSKKNIGYLTKRPSLVFLPHNIYNPAFYQFEKYKVAILCAVKIENTGNNLSFMEPALFFLAIKTYKLENTKKNAFRLKIEMFANFIFLMLFFFLVKLRLTYCSRRRREKYIIGTKKRFFKPSHTKLLFSAITTQPTTTNNYRNKNIKHVVINKLNKPKTINSSFRTQKQKFKTTNFKIKQKRVNTIPEDYIIRNTTRIGPARTTKKKYNFRRYFKYVQPRRHLKSELPDRKLMRFKKLVQIRFNLNDWVINMLKLKSKIQFYKKFLLTKAPYFALSNDRAGLYKLEMQLNFLLLRSFFAPDLKTANLLILNKYVVMNNQDNIKPTIKVSLMAIVSLPKLIQLTLFLFKPYRFSRFFMHRRVLRYLRYKYYFRRYILKKYHFFNFFNKRLHKLTKFRPVKQRKKKQNFHFQYNKNRKNYNKR